MEPKVITRIKGGIGNQLFCYAAARRLALVNNAELVIDDVSGFLRDHQYHRQYALNHFQIPCRKVTRAERLEPFDRYRRGLIKMLSRRKQFGERHYIEQEGLDFDKRLLHVKVRGTVYLDGYWQSANYFKDVEQVIREDLRIIPPTDIRNRDIAKNIQSANAVAVHVRWFDEPDANGIHNISIDYYQRAITLMDKKVGSPHYFVFSDNPDVARSRIPISDTRLTCVSHNSSDANSYADLWLMTQCRHFIIANSTFSWWGAWLGGGKNKIVVCPKNQILDGRITSWNFKGQLPDEWCKI